MLKRLIVVALLMLASGLEATGTQQKSQACDCAFRIDGVRGSLVNVGCTPPNGCVPGSARWSVAAGCGFNVGESVICVTDVTDGFCIPNSIYAGQVFSANAKAYLVTINTPIFFNELLCKVPSVEFQLQIDNNIVDRADCCPPATNVGFTSDGTPVVTLVFSSNTTVDASTQGVILRSSFVFIVDDATINTVHVPSILLLNQAICSLLGGSASLNPSANPTCPEFFIRSALKYNFIAQVTEGCC